MTKRKSGSRRGAQPKRPSSVLARRIAALPPAKRAAVADFVERLLDDDRALVAAAQRSSEAVFGRVWDNPDDAEYDRLQLRRHLPEPDRFVLTRSKGFYRREPVGISWFKAEASECISHAEELGRILDAQGISVERLRTAHPGYVAYEDGLQVVTIPFRDR